MMRWKDLKLGRKLGIGFGLLITIGIVLGIVGYRGLQSVDQTVQSADQANIAVKELYQTGVQRATFQNQGFEKTGEDGKSAYDRWSEKYSTLVGSVKSLENSSTLNEEQLKLAEQARKSVESYKASFEKMADARRDMDTAWGRWGEVGWSVTGEVGTANDEIIAPGKAKAIEAGDLQSVIRWSAIGKGLDTDVIEPFFLLRVTAVYFSRTLKDEQWANFQKQLQTTQDGFNRWAVDVKGNAQLEEAAKKLQGYLSTYREAGDQYYKAVQVGRTANIEMAAAIGDTVKNCDLLQASLEEEMHSVMSTANTVMIVLAIVGAIIGIFAAVMITRGIVLPMFQGVKFAEDIAQGDLTQQLQIDQQDEVGQLAGALNRMCANLRDVMANIQDSSEQVASSSEELSASAQSLSSGATEQAANLEETSASIEELTASVQNNAQNAQKANDISRGAAQDAEEGGSAVVETVQAMKQIAEQIRIVDDIADQTNLLALNAAIEAARAGEMGKGFAVVAVEVRKLAERSQEAAKEISSLAQNSVAQAEKAGNLIQKVVPDIQQTAELVQEISAACTEQSTGAEQINQAVIQLDQVTQQNSASSEESAAASEELAAQAQNMQTMVARFRIGNDGPRKTTVASPSRKAPQLPEPEPDHMEQVF